MPTNVECDDCGLTLLGLESGAPDPIDHDECPECGGTEFSLAE